VSYCYLTLHQDSTYTAPMKPNHKSRTPTGKAKPRTRTRTPSKGHNVTLYVSSDQLAKVWAPAKKLVRSGKVKYSLSLWASTLMARAIRDLGRER
jgi:hypothetical protein